jgi:hypothetical protein
MAADEQEETHFLGRAGFGALFLTTMLAIGIIDRSMSASSPGES